MERYLQYDILMQLLEALAIAKTLLASGQQEQARAVLKRLAAESPNQLWTSVVDLDRATVEDVTYLEWFVGQEGADAGGTTPQASAASATPFTSVDMANGLAHVRELLQSGDEQQARRELKELYVAAAPTQAPWLRFLVLDPPDVEELAYLEEFLRRHVTFDAQIQAQDFDEEMPSRSSEIANTFMTARAMLGAGRREEARWLLHQLTRTAPDYESAWLQLLALEPAPQEEIALLEEFLRHHPRHRFASAFRSRLDTVRMV